METGEVDIESNTPTALCKTSDVSSVAHGDALVVNSTTYSVVGVQADFGSGYQGTTLLILEEQ
jgi:expansin (peptidoglycan-binding protein)